MTNTNGSTIDTTFASKIFHKVLPNFEEENKKMGIENEIIIIGGGHLFNETASSMNKLVITRVDCDIEGDIFYPDIDLSSWKLVKTESYKKDMDNDYDFKIEEYVNL